MERVADLLRHRCAQFNKISPTRSVLDALHQMHAENVDHLIVMDEEKFLGILTEHGITEKIVFRANDLDTAVVKEFMSTYLPVATPNDSLDYCMQLMERHNVNHIAIYERFTFEGILSAHELMKEMLMKSKGIFNDNRERIDGRVY